MISTRRLALSVLCTASLATALAVASPALADQSAPATPAATDCGATSADIEGTFTGAFDNTPADTLSVTFSTPGAVATNWTVQGWQGQGTGKFEFGDTGPQWTNSNLLTGVVSGTDSETYRSVSVSCAAGDTRATTINGVVDSGSAEIPFTITRS